MITREKELMKEIESETLQLAITLHNQYEILSREKGWETQKKCQVDFFDLPKKNQDVMIAISNWLMIWRNISKSNVLQETKKKILDLIEYEIEKGEKQLKINKQKPHTLGAIIILKHIKQKIKEM